MTQNPKLNVYERTGQERASIAQSLLSESVHLAKPIIMGMLLATNK
jgi:hypothetical protein